MTRNLIQKLTVVVLFVLGVAAGAFISLGILNSLDHKLDGPFFSEQEINLSTKVADINKPEMLPPG